MLIKQLFGEIMLESLRYLITRLFELVNGIIFCGYQINNIAHISLMCPPARNK